MTSKRIASSLHDDRGSLPMVLLVSLLGAVLTGLLVPVLLNQAHSTRFVSTRVQALDAAQAGIDVTLGRIRAATGASGAGDVTQLPCASSGSPITGSADQAGTLDYSVTIDYFTVDPTTHPAATPMSCVSGYGTYDSSTGTALPGWARITSTHAGSGVNGSSQGRTLTAIYRFQINYGDASGGIMRIFPASNGKGAKGRCLDTSTTPTAGTIVLTQVCSDTTVAQQSFMYRSDLTIQLASSASATYPNGLCLAYVNPVVGDPIVLEPCGPLGRPAAHQQWNFNEYGALRAYAPPSSPTPAPAVCIGVPNSSPGETVVLYSCDNTPLNPHQTWIPAPTVGSGDISSTQLMNHNEFLRCLTVPGTTAPSTSLIDYPCAQTTTVAEVPWTQRFTLPTESVAAGTVQGQILTSYNGVDYCVTSPGASGKGVSLTACGTGDPTLQTWTVYDGENAVPSAQRFTVVDSAGRCMGLLGTSNGKPQGSSTWSTVDVEACDSSRDDQRWNVDLTTASVTTQYEK